MKTIGNYSTFERISSNMAREFGTIKRGQEERYAMMLFPIESNLIKVNRRNGVNNGRRAMEAVKISLFTINGYLNGWKYDFGQYLTAENKDYVDAILHAIDPFTNEELAAAVSQWHDLNSTDDLREHFDTPVKCLLRIESSMQQWTNDYGPSGYFDFLEGLMGNQIIDDKLNFTVQQR